jgi:hypothetical protein
LDGNVNRAIDALIRSFDDDVEESVDRIKVAKHMLAKLHGQNFRVEAKSPEQITVVKGQSVKWTWHVEPIEAGRNKLLFLELYAVVPRGAGLLPPVLVKTFEARIDVSVGVLDKIMFYAERWHPLISSLDGIASLIGWICAAAAAVWGLWRLLTRGARKAL